MPDLGRTLDWSSHLNLTVLSPKALNAQSYTNVMFPFFRLMRFQESGEWYILFRLLHYARGKLIETVELQQPSS